MMKRMLSFALIVSALNSYAGQTEFPKFDAENAKVGISATYSPAAVEKLTIALKSEIDKMRIVEDPKDQAKANESADRLTNYALTLASGGTTEAQKIENYRNLRSLLYAVRSENLGPIGGSGGAVGNFLSGDLTFPNVLTSDLNKPLTAQAAALESSNLVDPVSGKEYASPKDLAGLSVNQVSQLDVSEDNTFWYTEARLNQIKAEAGSNWNYLEKNIEQAVSAKIGQPFKLDTARRILKFKGLKSTATSPKVDTTDLYDQDWKLKWGEEVHTEPIANRLYANLGGKYQDLVYANKGGIKEVILVLDENSPESQNPKMCSKISSIEKLKSCLKSEGICIKSNTKGECIQATKYNFDLSPYLIDHDPKSPKVVTQDMLDNSELTFGILPSEERQKLIGRQYAIFNESMVEFQPSKKIALRLGAAPFSDAGAVENRAKRGAITLSYFLNNKDAKDDNNRAVVYAGEFIEYMHDLGASMGDIKYSGWINKMESDFVGIKGKTVSMLMTVLYKPEAFKKVSFADAKWMARKIVALTEEDIRSAVESANWPDFQTEILTQLFLYRKNLVGQIFQEGTQSNLHIAPIQVDLRTRQNREDAAVKYGLTLVTKGDVAQAANMIETTMKNAGVKIDANGNSSFVDTVATADGSRLMTGLCEKSVIVSVLENSVRPSGLGRRVSRRSDDKPLPACAPKKLN